VKKMGKKAKIHPPTPTPYLPPASFKDLLICHFFIYLAQNHKSEHLGLAKLLPMAENRPCTPSPMPVADGRSKFCRLQNNYISPLKMEYTL